MWCLAHRSAIQAYAAAVVIIHGTVPCDLLVQGIFTSRLTFATNFGVDTSRHCLEVL